MKMLEKDWVGLSFFNESEFKHPKKMDRKVLMMLDVARGHANTPFKLTSTFREGDPRSHGKGLGVDIGCTTSANRWKIVTGLMFAGFKRIGVYDKHVHGDIDEDVVQQVIWIGESK